MRAAGGRVFTTSPPLTTPTLAAMGRLLDRLAARSPNFARLRDWIATRRKRLVGGFVLTMHVLGAFSSVQAVMSTRTPQGAIAWVVSLNTFPYVAVPAYWIFGQSHFDGYEIERHRDFLQESDSESAIMTALRERGLEYEPQDPDERRQVQLLEELSLLPHTRGNDVDLLIDGEATFDAIEASIAKAEDYVLFQFYILRSDDLGNRLKDAMIERARTGVRCFVLYDGYGSKDLAPSYLRELREAGIETAEFNTTTGSGNRFRMNFRNHRKIVVVDGRESFVGGHNVGVEYLGLDPDYGDFRDTHVAMRGPVVLATQVAFFEDWHWTTGRRPELNWSPEAAPEGDVVAACLPTGPADEFETMSLVLLDRIHTATTRVWIATPYFVPDEQLVSALQLAGLRGVDVRVIVPDSNNNLLVDLTSYSYLADLERAGVKFFRYERGFMHQKVFVVDDELASIGTANFDNRSMRLNFEITMIFHDPKLAAEVRAMLQRDLEQSRPFLVSEYTERALPFRFAVRAARLLAPIL